MKMVPIVIRWRNGDRQFAEVEFREHPKDTIMWKVGDLDGGGHPVGEVVSLRLMQIGMTAAARLPYVEWA